MFKPKMSLKRFWEILEETGIYKKSWGYEGILNMIILVERRDAEEMKKLGLYNSAKRNDERADKIFEELMKLGYYD